MKTKKAHLTKQRQVILDVLSKTHFHPNADEIYFMAKKIIPSLNLSSVYRNLEYLTGCGLILRLEFSGDIKRYEIKKAPHHHFRCNSCGVIFDIDYELVPVSFQKTSSQGHVVQGLKLELSGICRECKTKENINEN